MGTEIQLKSNLPGHRSMRDLNEDSNSCSWSLFNGERSLQNGHYYDGVLLGAGADIYSVCGKDTLKEKMLEHEAIFKKQVYELHRLYKIQKDLMDDVRRKEALKPRMPVETSLASSPLGSQITCEDTRRWQSPSFLVPNPNYATLSAEGIHSPISSMKGHSTPSATFASPNGGIFKTSEVPDCRPSKVRRKMIDLRLPADEYIDTDDQEQVDHGKDMSNFPNQECKFGFHNAIDIVRGDSGKTDSVGHASESGLHAKKRNVADLNQPIEVDETNASPYIDLESQGFPHGEICVQEHSFKPKSNNLGLPYDDAQSSHRGSNNGTLFNLRQVSERHRRGLFPHMLEAGDIKGKKSTSHGLHVRGLLNEVHDAPYNQTDQSTVAQSSERTICGLETSVNAQRPESVMPSLEKAGKLSQNALPFQMHPCMVSSSTHSASTQPGDRNHAIYGGKLHDRDVRPNRGFGKELLNQNGFSNGYSLDSKEPSSRFPVLSYSFGDRKLPSKDFIDHTAAKYDGCSGSINAKTGREVDLNRVLGHGTSNSFVLPEGGGISDAENKRGDHAVMLPWLRGKTGGQNEVTVRSDPNSRGSNLHQPSSSICLTSNNEAGKGLTQMLSQSTRSDLCSNQVDAKRSDVGAFSSNKKILGFPIFEKPPISKNDSFSLNSPSVSLPHMSEGEVVEKEKKVRLLDINLPCDSVCELGKPTPIGTPAVQKGIGSTTSSTRHQIDLNLCVSDDETVAMPSVSTTCTNGKRISGIDLEAPVVPDSEDIIFDREVAEKEGERSTLSLQQENGHRQNEIVKVAAETIVALSSASHQNYLNKINSRSPMSLEDTLNWFADIVVLCVDGIGAKLEAAAKDINRRYDEDSSSEETDYFESMTLKLTETKSDDYLPKPFIPETLSVDESAAATSTPSRSRRGQVRRGRQRRDFQRDILPGLASLSRHEVTEDLQTFGGLMRATGHVWQSGLTRRNSRTGCARGRRRSTGSVSAVTSVGPNCTPLIQQLNNIEVGVGLEERSLTGWGKTTRRPRRQRCPAGNPPSLALT
ncbi:hypothetical protein BT93_G1760 [Corymbia citriodora subsp. variegata]|nr:hypothetical protein BT93_G1760 [Corymbia citriodora subsp. variegata]